MTKSDEIAKRALDVLGATPGCDASRFDKNLKSNARYCAEEKSAFSWSDDWWVFSTLGMLGAAYNFDVFILDTHPMSMGVSFVPVNDAN
jgi:hypothetical protein